MRVESGPASMWWLLFWKLMPVILVGMVSKGLSDSHQLIACYLFTLWERAQCSSFRGLAGVIRCVFFLVCALIVIQTDNQNLRWIVGKGIADLSLLMILLFYYTFCV